MLSKGLLKRLLPFFATFALGLLVASFFVSIAAPNLTFRRSWHRHDEDRGCNFSERQEWKAERRFKQRKFERRIRQNADLNELVPPPPPLAPVPPVPPSRIQ